MIKVKPQTVAAKQIKLSWEDENIQRRTEEDKIKPQG